MGEPWEFSTTASQGGSWGSNLENDLMKGVSTHHWKRRYGRAGLDDLETYIYIWQNMMAQYIATRPILDLCLVAERQPGARVV